VERFGKRSFVGLLLVLLVVTSCQNETANESQTLNPVPLTSGPTPTSASVEFDVRRSILADLGSDDYVRLDTKGVAVPVSSDDVDVEKLYLSSTTTWLDASSADNDGQCLGWHFDVQDADLVQSLYSLQAALSLCVNETYLTLPSGFDAPLDLALTPIAIKGAYREAEDLLAVAVASGTSEAITWSLFVGAGSDMAEVAVPRCSGPEAGSEGVFEPVFVGEAIVWPVSCKNQVCIYSGAAGEARTTSGLHDSFCLSGLRMFGERRALSCHSVILMHSWGYDDELPIPAYHTEIALVDLSSESVVWSVSNVPALYVNFEDQDCEWRFES
jgi:hypothetical protein